MVEPQGCSTWAAVAGAVLNETTVRRNCVLALAGVCRVVVVVLMCEALLQDRGRGWNGRVQWHVA
jgi:hypothetical protein